MCPGGIRTSARRVDRFPHICRNVFLHRFIYKSQSIPVGTTASRKVRMTTREKLSPSYISGSTYLISNIFRLQTFTKLYVQVINYGRVLYRQTIRQLTGIFVIWLTFIDRLNVPDAVGDSD